MKKLQPVLASVVLCFLLSVATFADGIIETGKTPPPPPAPTSTTTTQPSGTTSTNTSPDALMETALALLQALLALLP